jgi:hypothetical protein
MFNIGGAMTPIRHRQLILATILVLASMISGCGPTPEDLTATAGVLTAAAATDTPPPSPTPLPTNTPTPTSTPIPYDLSLIVIGEDDAAIEGASVVLDESSSDSTHQVTDNMGQVYWENLPVADIKLTIKAQGYFPRSTSQTLERGVSSIDITLDRDPHGILPAEACAPKETLLYIEDFQDSEAQGWEEIEYRAQGLNIGPHPDSQGDVVLIKPADSDAQTYLREFDAENYVLRLQFMPVGRPSYVASIYFKNEPYEFLGDQIDFSGYQLVFEPTYLVAFRGADPKPTIEIGGFEGAFKAGEWHLLEMSIYDRVLEVWIDGARYIHYTDPKPLPNGTILLEAWASDETNIIYFDDISVCALSEPFAPILTAE